MMREEDYRPWIGRSEETEDDIDAWRLGALAALFDRDDPPPEGGDLVAPAGHWLYFLAATPHGERGPDGHAKRGGFLPPVDLPRRMWAGGRLEFRDPLRVNDRARRLSTIESVSCKQGRSGPLVFVTIRHRISAEGRVALIEDQDLVYRGMPDADAPPPTARPAPQNPAWHRAVTTDPVLLFRYSALTYNGHRIHYDAEYCRTVEGYPGPVVHAPLMASLLLDLVRRNRPATPIASFSFKALRPAFAGDVLHLEGDGEGGLWVRGEDGTMVMEAHCALETDH